MLLDVHTKRAEPRATRFGMKPECITTHITRPDSRSDQYLGESERFRHGYMGTYGSGRPISQQRDDKYNMHTSRLQRGTDTNKAEAGVKERLMAETKRLLDKKKATNERKKLDQKEYQRLLDLKAGFANDRMHTAARYDLHLHPENGTWHTDPSFGECLPGGRNVSEGATSVLQYQFATPAVRDSLSCDRWKPMSQNHTIPGKAYAP